MKNILFIIILIIVLPITSQARSKSMVPDVRKFKTQLELTTDQLNQLNTLYNNFDARAKLQAPAETRKEQLVQKMELNREMRHDVMNVLTPKQRIEFYKIIQIKRNQKKIK